jgi:hypothetical protein
VCKQFPISGVLTFRRLMVLSLVGSSIAAPRLMTSCSSGTTAARGSVCRLMLTDLIVWFAFIIDRGEIERNNIEQRRALNPERLNSLQNTFEEPAGKTHFWQTVTIELAMLLTGLSRLDFRLCNAISGGGRKLDRPCPGKSTLRSELPLRHLLIWKLAAAVCQYGRDAISGAICIGPRSDGPRTASVAPNYRQC